MKLTLYTEQYSQKQYCPITGDNLVAYLYVNETNTTVYEIMFTNYDEEPPKTYEIDSEYDDDIVNIYDKRDSKENDEEVEYGQCEYCGGPNAIHVPDPFMNEVHGIDTEVWICQECWNERYMSI